MNSDDLELSARLGALEARAPGGDELPRDWQSRRSRGFALPFAAGPVLALALVASAAAGGAAVLNLVRGYEGVENPGQPLAGARLECMAPREAAAFLESRGFTDVVWQVERDDPSAGGKGTATEIVSFPPEHGYVVPGAIADDGRLHMVIDQRASATGVGVCSGEPMP